MLSISQIFGRDSALYLISGSSTRKPGSPSTWFSILDSARATFSSRLARDDQKVAPSPSWNAEHGVAKWPSDNVPVGTMLRICTDVISFFLRQRTPVSSTLILIGPLIQVIIHFPYNGKGPNSRCLSHREFPMPIRAANGWKVPNLPKLRTIPNRASWEFYDARGGGKCGACIASIWCKPISSRAISEMMSLNQHWEIDVSVALYRQWMDCISKTTLEGFCWNSLAEATERCTT